MSGGIAGRSVVLPRLVGVALAVLVVSWLGASTDRAAVSGPTPVSRPGAVPPNGAVTPGTIRRFPFALPPGQLAVEDGVAYVALGSYAPFQLARVDGGTGSVTTVSLPGQPIGVAAGEGGLWVGSCEGAIPLNACPRNAVLRLDPTTLATVARIPLEQQPFHIEVSNGYVWVGLAGPHEGAIARIDPTTNRIERVIPAPVGAFEEGMGYVWMSVLTDRRGSVVRIDPATGRQRWIPRPERYTEACGLALGEGAAWVLMCLPSRGSELWHIDPGGEPMARIPFPRSARIDAADGFVWLATTNQQNLQLEVRRLDPVIDQFVGEPIFIPRDSEAIQHFSCDALGSFFPPDVEVGDGALWLISPCDGEVIRVQR